MAAMGDAFLATLARHHPHRVPAGAVGVEAARALATALLAAPSSCIASLTVGSPPLEVPVAGLLGRPAGITPLHTLDLSDVSAPPLGPRPSHMQRWRRTLCLGW